MSDEERQAAPRAPTGAMLAVVMLPEDANPDGFVHGGAIMKLADTTAGVCAGRYARCRVATVAVQEITFISPAEIGDVITVRARLVKVGRTSMTIEVTIHAEGRISQEVRQTGRGRFIFVALDHAGRPAPLPALLDGS